MLATELALKRVAFPIACQSARRGATHVLRRTPARARANTEATEAEATAPAGARAGAEQEGRGQVQTAQKSLETVEAFW